jgi:hypothetical protein
MDRSKRPRVACAALMAIALVIVLGACSDSPPPNYVVSHQSSDVLPACASKPKTDCYTPGQMRDFYARIVGNIYDHWLGVGKKNLDGFEKIKFIYIPKRTTVDVGCVQDNTQNSFSEGFCHKQFVVYMGESKLQEYYGDGQSDLLPALILVEILMSAYPLDQSDPINGINDVAAWVRNLPDCMAGVFWGANLEDRPGAIQVAADNAAVETYRKRLSKREKSAFNSGKKNGSKACFKDQIPPLKW